MGIGMGDIDRTAARIVQRLLVAVTPIDVDLRQIRTTEVRHVERKLDGRTLLREQRPNGSPGVKNVKRREDGRLEHERAGFDNMRWPQLALEKERSRTLAIAPIQDQRTSADDPDPDRRGGEAPVIVERDYSYELDVFVAVLIVEVAMRCGERLGRRVIGHCRIRIMGPAGEDRGAITPNDFDRVDRIEWSEIGDVTGQDHEAAVALN